MYCCNISCKVYTAMNVQTVDFWVRLWRHAVMYVFTNISEEPATQIAYPENGDRGFFRCHNLQDYNLGYWAT